MIMDRKLRIRLVMNFGWGWNFIFTDPRVLDNNATGGRISPLQKLDLDFLVYKATPNEGWGNSLQADEIYPPEWKLVNGEDGVKYLRYLTAINIVSP
jgi:hypothetical protein